MPLTPEQQQRALERINPGPWKIIAGIVMACIWLLGAAKGGEIGGCFGAIIGFVLAVIVSIVLAIVVQLPFAKRG